MALNWAQSFNGLAFGWILFPRPAKFPNSISEYTGRLQEIYAALPADWKMFVEYKAYEPNFYSTTIGDWGQSYLLHPNWVIKAYTLVDLGHHFQGTNIEQIVSFF